MEAKLKVREKEIEKRSEDSKAVTGEMLQMMAVMQDQLNYTRQKEEKERQEQEVQAWEWFADPLISAVFISGRKKNY